MWSAQVQEKQFKLKKNVRNATTSQVSNIHIGFRRSEGTF